MGLALSWKDILLKRFFTVSSYLTLFARSTALYLALATGLCGMALAQPTRH